MGVITVEFPVVCTHEMRIADHNAKTANNRNRTAMKTLITTLLLLATTATYAQEGPAVKLWAAANGTGMVSQVIPSEGEVPELRMELRGKVRSLEVATGYVAVFHDREDLEGLRTLRIEGPKRINDLSVVPMPGLRANWNGAIASVAVSRNTEASPDVPTIEPMVACGTR